MKNHGIAGSPLIWRCKNASEKQRGWGGDPEEALGHWKASDDHMLQVGPGGVRTWIDVQSRAFPIACDKHISKTYPHWVPFSSKV